jgi:hypothetical protein
MTQRSIFAVVALVVLNVLTAAVGGFLVSYFRGQKLAAESELVSLREQAAVLAESLESLAIRTERFSLEQQQFTADYRRLRNPMAVAPPLPSLPVRTHPEVAPSKRYGMGGAGKTADKRP